MTLETYQKGIHVTDLHMLEQWRILVIVDGAESYHDTTSSYVSALARLSDWLKDYENIFRSYQK